MYWINGRGYKTLESAINAYEEYKKNERILNGEGLAPLPRNLNFHNHYQEVVPDVIKEVSAYDMLGNKIATWDTPSQNNTRASVYVDFGPPPRMPEAKIGTLYFDKDTNKMWMLNSEKKWVCMVNYGEYKTTAAKDIKDIANCRNCGAPIRGYRCEYCGTAY